MQFAVTADAHVASVALRRSPRRVGRAGNLAPLDPEIRGHEYCAAILTETGSEGCLESRYRSTVLVRQPGLDGRPRPTGRCVLRYWAKWALEAAQNLDIAAQYPTQTPPIKKHPITG